MKRREKVLVTSAPPGAGAWNRSGLCKPAGRIQIKEIQKIKIEEIADRKTQSPTCSANAIRTRTSCKEETVGIVRQMHLRKALKKNNSP